MASSTADMTADMKRVVADVYLRPAYVTVGLTDLAVEKMRQANLFDPVQLHRESSAQAEKTLKQIQQAPAILVKRGRKLAEQTQADYVQLAERGEQVVERLRNQRSTKELVGQFDNTVSITKGAMTKARARGAASRTSGVAKSGPKSTSGRAKAAATTARKSPRQARVAASDKAEQLG